jgi:hypothetical protein
METQQSTAIATLTPEMLEIDTKLARKPQFVSSGSTLADNIDSDSDSDILVMDKAPSNSSTKVSAKKEDVEVDLATVKLPKFTNEHEYYELELDESEQAGLSIPRCIETKSKWFSPKSFIHNLMSTLCMARPDDDLSDDEE